MEKRSPVTRSAAKISKVDPILAVYGARSPFGLPILLFGLGGYRDDNRVMVYGYNGVSAFIGCLEYSQAIEFLAYNF